MDTKTVVAEFFVCFPSSPNMLKNPLPKIRVNIFPNKMVHLDASKHHLDLSDLCPKTPLEKKITRGGYISWILSSSFWSSGFLERTPQKTSQRWLNSSNFYWNIVVGRLNLINLSSTCIQTWSKMVAKRVYCQRYVICLRIMHLCSHVCLPTQVFVLPTSQKSFTCLHEVLSKKQAYRA